MRTTFMASPATIDRKWYVVDASGKNLGRLASEIASVLRGKHKPIFTPHIDTGDYVIVVNVDKIKVSGKKLEQKVYYHHSGYVGGMRETTLKDMLAKKKREFLSLKLRLAILKMVEFIELKTNSIRQRLESKSLSIKMLFIIN